MKFRNDFGNLIKEIKECDRHYLRCLKPNEIKKKEFVVAGYLFNQINNLGILDYIKVRKQNFPVRKEYKDFLFLCFELYEILFYKWNKYENISSLIVLTKEDINIGVAVNSVELEKYRNVALSILEIYFKGEENKLYLLGINKIFMLESFLFVIQERKKQIYLLRNAKAKIIKRFWSYILKCLF